MYNTFNSISFNTFYKNICKIDHLETTKSLFINHLSFSWHSSTMNIICTEIFLDYLLATCCILGALPSLGMTLETMNKQIPALLDFTFKESRQTYK